MHNYRMLGAGMKTVLAAVLLMFLSSQVVRAEVKVYQYDGKLPFVQMMLNMMVAMGILDRLPTNSRYGLGAYPSSAWSGASNPYTRALALRGFSPGSSFFSPYGNNPLMSSPWSQSSSATNGADWGSPNWGVLPVESYATSNYSPYGYAPYNSLQANPYWSSDELNGWVNEPWETSEWNPKAEPSAANRSVRPSQPQVLQTVPLVQNFNYNAAAPTSTNEAPNNRTGKPTPLAKLARPVRPSAGRNVQPSYRQSPLSKRVNQNRVNKKSRNKPLQKPCITDFCGLKIPNLNGLWVAQDGEMLGIKNNRYLWSDSSSRYLTGKIKIQNEYLLTNVDGHDRLIRFKYKLAGNHLLTMQPDGKIREFARMRTDQYNNRAQGNYNWGGYKQRDYQ